MPATSVLKISGAMIILIRRRKSWLNGLKYWAQAGLVRLTMRAGDDPEDQPEDDLLGQGQAGARGRAPGCGWGHARILSRTVRV